MKSNSLLLLICLVFTVIGGGLVSAEKSGDILFSLEPSLIVPVGSSSDLFKTGTDLSLSAYFYPVSIPFAAIYGGLSYGLLPIESEDSITTVSAVAGPSFRYKINDHLSLGARAAGGFYYWYPSGWDAGYENGLSAALSAGLTGTYRFNETWSLSTSPSFRYYSKLYSSMNMSIGLSYGFPLHKSEKSSRNLSGSSGQIIPLDGTVKIISFDIGPVFPVLYKYYDSNSLGTITVENRSKMPIKNVNAVFYADRYMDNPMKLKEIKQLDAGKSAVIEVFGLFTEELLSITEGTKASSKITLSYIQGGKEKTKEYNPVFEVFNRNAMSWDNDRKISSFITAKDPEILNFSRKVINSIQSSINRAVDENFQKGISLFEALNLYGLSYEVDPVTPFSEFSKDKAAVDFLQFPRQTLQYMSGDCDDLSALYTAMLESVGVETAVITIPGHIFAAFSLESDPQKARKSFSRPDNLIFHDGKVWVPVEITEVKQGFLKAWQSGASQWNEYRSQNLAGFYPVREAWKKYQPVGFREGDIDLLIPDNRDISLAFSKSLNRHVEKEITPQIEELERNIQKGVDILKNKNSLGVVYARYGMYEKALSLFENVLSEHKYFPALTNIGNIYFIMKEYPQALKYYQQAYENDNNNRVALLGLTRCSHRLENYGAARENYRKLKILDPVQANRFAYLEMRGEESSRAAKASGAENDIIWEEGN